MLCKDRNGGHFLERPNVLAICGCDFQLWFVLHLFLPMVASCQVDSILLSSDVDDELKQLAGHCCEQVFVADP